MSGIRYALAGLACAVTLLAAPAPDFARQVQPILHARCAHCHSGSKPQAGLSLLTREGLLKGGVNGPAVRPGASAESLLVRRVSDLAPRMPLGGPALSAAEITVLKEWIDAGAKWDAAAPAPALDTRIRPRTPAVPRSSHANPIDAFVQRYWDARKIPAPALAGDAAFLRRASFDLIGLPPTPEELDRFEKDPDPDKRAKSIEALLARRSDYAEHWISFWNDLLRNEDGARLPGEKRLWITSWLRQSLESNMPYDEFVRSLLNPVGPGAPEGFLAGINWGGDVSASQTPAMQAAQNSAQIFLGASLKCAGCHDSFVNRWKLAQTFGLAAYFAAEPPEIARCDVKTGERAVPAFPFEELAETPAATVPARREQVARLFTTPRNGRFARTLVNRYWKLLIGRGIVEPVDDLEAPAWDADLLDWLASDFTSHGYDLQHLLRRILTSRVYQSEASRRAEPPKRGEPYVFRGPEPRRLTAEQFVDSVSAITGEWKALDDLSGKPAPYARAWRFRASALTRALGRPDRTQVITERDEEVAMLQALELVNGGELRSQLRRGSVRLAGVHHDPPRNLADTGQVTAAAPVEADLTGARQLVLWIEDFGSYDRAAVKAGWADAELIGPSGVARLRDLPLPAGAVLQSLHPKDGQPKEALMAAKLVYDIAGKGFTRFRATAVLDQSGLRVETTAKVRFLVFGEQPNPEDLIRTTGEPPVPRPAPAGGAPLAQRLFRAAFARMPNAAEMAEAKRLLREGPEGVEDFLWILFLSPEFQLLR